MKIVLIGTFPPYRGGISSFYHSLANYLSENHQVFAINFTTQYPGILFPGKSQFGEPMEVVKYDSIRILSSINPISWLITSKRIITIQPDLIICKYWMPFFAPSFGSVLKQVKSKLQTKTLVVCDNIIPHEKRPFDKLLTKYFFNKVDSFVVMSKTVENDLITLFPNAKYLYIPHPLYNIFGKGMQSDKARHLLDIKEENILLYFGYIRPYKGLDVLIKSAKILKNKLNNFKILVVGDCYENPNRYKRMIKKYTVEDVIDLHLEFIPVNKVNLYFSAADVIVLPYKSATQSGIVPIAYHFNKPVVVTNVGGLLENVVDGKSGFIIDSENPRMLANILADNFNSSIFSEMGDFIKTYKKKFSWEHFVNGIESLYSHI